MMINLKNILSMFFPTRCPFCGVIILADEFVCKNCQKKINPKKIKNTLYTRNGKNFLSVAPFAYVEPIRSAIHDYKFRGAKSFAIPFGRYISDVLSEVVDITKVDLITSVPLNKARKRERGFNQSEIFAREISRVTGIRYIETLKKVRNNKVQHELSLDQRAENVKNVYAVLDKTLVEEKRIIICDDILTTGNTMAECANMLFESGAKEVTGATIANVESRKKLSIKN